jgi:hypothetical protein
MKKSSWPLLSFVLLSTSLLAQSPDSGTPKQERFALVTLTKYCARVENLSDSQPPRIFAQVFSGLGPTEGWAEFDSKAAWEEAGEPKPIALVWYDAGDVVRVAITFDDGRSYADYCYRPDGKLAQLRSLPAVKTQCDASLFHCEVTVRGGCREYPPEGMLASSLLQRTGIAPFPETPGWDLDLDGFLLLKALKPEKASVTSAPMNWPEYLSVRDLPFNRLLYVSSETTK